MQVRIMATRVTKVALKTTYDDDKQELTTVVQTNVQLSTNDLARLHSLLSQKVSLYFVIGSLQAQFDLRTEKVELPKPKGEGEPLSPEASEKLDAFTEEAAVAMQEPKAPPEPKPSPAPSAPRANAAIIHVEPEMMKKARASYSGTEIAAKDSRVKKPFEFMGKNYVRTGDSLNGDLKHGLECYALVVRADYPGEVGSYHVPAGREYQEYYGSLRKKPEGFYHGMAVKYGKKECVLVGPPVVLVEEKQKPLTEGEE